MTFQNKVRVAFITLLVCCAGLSVFRLVTPHNQSDISLQAHVNQVASHLHAPGDQDTLTVATSSLATAEHIRFQIQQDILKGMSDSEILHAMQNQYGTQILAVPPMQGFGSVIWMGVWVCLLGSAALAWYGWRRISLKRSEAGLHEQWHELKEAQRMNGEAPETSASMMQRLREYL